MYPYGFGALKLDQKVDPIGGPFGSPVISKSCFQLSIPWTPPPLTNIAENRVKVYKIRDFNGKMS